MPNPTNTAPDRTVAQPDPTSAATAQAESREGRSELLSGCELDDLGYITRGGLSSHDDVPSAGRFSWPFIRSRSGRVTGGATSRGHESITNRGCLKGPTPDQAIRCLSPTPTWSAWLTASKSRSKRWSTDWPASAC